MAAPSRLKAHNQPRHRYALFPRRAAAAGALALTTRYKNHLTDSCTYRSAW
ncbi:hypothetical protein CZ787_02265 [Halomonas citrativorans]|uniref:Uncharacterized protein n=1 Tax=Halomonas citrativorans TaxID=2742612 RepID=A0A1R4HQJ5_9GAMM|nr:hypothetical protein CZ787_02265 [Halomonas citrativorans]